MRFSVLLHFCESVCFCWAADWTFDMIIDIALVGSGKDTLAEFWAGYVGGDKHNGIKSFYQNTIEYNQPPTLTIPNQHVLGGISYPHIIDLWDMANDEESYDYQLDFRIANLPDYHCGIALESDRWININPAASWSGTCGVLVEVSDSIETHTKWFTVTVSEVTSRSYLPIVLND